MANITVAELLLDPDFVDPIVVLRRVEKVGDDGVAMRGTQPINTFASIQAARGDNLDLGADAARVSSTYECITTFPLVVATDTTSADFVIWRGMTFIVTNVSVFANFAGGVGHYEAMMEMRPLRTNNGQGLTIWDSGVTVWDNGQTLWDVPGTPAQQTVWDGGKTVWNAGDTVWDVKP